VVFSVSLYYGLQFCRILLHILVLKTVWFFFCFLLAVGQISASGATIGGLNFNNSSSGATGNLSSRVPMPLASVADAGRS